MSILLVAGPAATTTPSAATAAPAATSAADPDLDDKKDELTPVVKLRARPAIELQFDEAAPARAEKTHTATPAALPAKSQTERQACTQPLRFVPLSQDCKRLVRVVAASATVLPSTYAPSLEVRAAIDRGVARAAAARVKSRPPPASKTAKERPIPKIRPIVPFGGHGVGMTNDGFSGTSAATSTSRMFALAAVPLRVPRPFTLARLRLQRTIPHGEIAAPPPARPG